MKETNYGALPVIDKNEKVIGIVTDRDVCLSLVKHEKQFAELSVKDAIAHLKVHSVKAEDTIKDALHEMRKNKVVRLPITDKEGKLKGLISINNILSHAITKKEDLGNISSTDENLAKTIKTLFDRNSSLKTEKKTGKEYELEQEIE